MNFAVKLKANFAASRKHITHIKHPLSLPSLF